MSNETEIIAITQKLLDSVVQGDWDTYQDLCDHSMTCFEPEARGHLVTGMSFHKFYFDHLSHRALTNSTIVNPGVRFLSDDIALISYIRLTQRISESTAMTSKHEETRLWQRQNGNWKLVHLHRSGND